MSEKCFDLSLKSTLLVDEAGKNLVEKKRPSVAHRPDFLDLANHYKK